MSRELRVGIIGTGKRGLAYSRTVTQHEGAHLGAVFDLDADRAHLVSGWSGDAPRVAASIPDLLDDVDVAIIATPDRAHPEALSMCLAREVPTLCEKPLALELDTLNELAVQVDRSSAPLVVSMVLRYEAFYLDLLRTVAELGRPTTFAVTDLLPGAFYFRRWHRFRHQTSSLALHEGIHSLDIAAHVMDLTSATFAAVGGGSTFADVPAGAAGRCSACSLRDRCPYAAPPDPHDLRQLFATARGQEGEPRDLCVYNPQTDVEEVTSAVAETARGATLTYTLNLTSPQRTRRFVVVGEGWSVEADEASATIVVRRDGTVDHHTARPLQGGDRAQLASLLAVARSGGGGDFAVEPLFAANAAGIAITTSLRRRTAVDLRRDAGTAPIYRASMTEAI